MTISIQRIKNQIQKLSEPFLDFIYPPMCLGCNIAIPAGDVLCTECVGNLIEFEWDENHSQFVLDALHVPLQAVSIHVGYEFEEESVLQRCIHEMKYRNMKSIGFWFGRLLGERLVETDIVHDNPILVPVPLNKIKKYERGYNQSEWICKGIAFETGLDVMSDALNRTRYTKSQAQAKLHADERKGNVKDAFAVSNLSQDLIKGRSIMLVDDLITTGATTNECIEKLKVYDTKNLHVLALAMPLKKSLFR